MIERERGGGGGGGGGGEKNESKERDLRKGREIDRESSINEDTHTHHTHRDVVVCVVKKKPSIFLKLRRVHATWRDTKEKERDFEKS
ncbi:MAG: hypothetical protein VXU42_07225 [Verrucomicrobiota bacterium]|nr:hypothetical protein [Verrucomicrobiota bacterium]